MAYWLPADLPAKVRQWALDAGVSQGDLVATCLDTWGSWTANHLKGK